MHRFSHLSCWAVTQLTRRAESESGCTPWMLSDFHKNQSLRLSLEKRNFRAAWLEDGRSGMEWGRSRAPTCPWYFLVGWAVDVQMDEKGPQRGPERWGCHALLSPMSAGSNIKRSHPCTVGPVLAKSSSAVGGDPEGAKTVFQIHISSIELSIWTLSSSVRCCYSKEVNSCYKMFNLHSRVSLLRGVTFSDVAGNTDELQMLNTEPLLLGEILDWVPASLWSHLHHPVNT